MVLGDGLIGQMMEPVDMEQASNRQPAADLQEKTWAATGHKPTQEAPRAIINSLYIDPVVLEQHCMKLQAKYDAIEAAECRWQEEMLEDAEIVIVAYGTTARIARSAMRKCREKGIKVGMIRPITLWPFPEAAIRATLKTAKKFLCVEMSTGQMIDDVKLAVNGERPVEFYGRTGGMVPTVSEIVAKLEGMVDGPCAVEQFLNQTGAAVNQAAAAAQETFAGIGQKIEAKVNDPAFVEKTEALKQKTGELAGKAFDGLAKGATLLGEGLSKAFDALNGLVSGNNDNNDKEGNE
jgi:TPP-dependent indolepyruvate ferredoxin oxidoreductase alpha subunit